VLKRTKIYSSKDSKVMKKKKNVKYMGYRDKKGEIVEICKKDFLAP
jgi:hypothetical protein